MVTHYFLTPTHLLQCFVEFYALQNVHILLQICWQCLQAECVRCEAVHLIKVEMWKSWQKTGFCLNYLTLLSCLIMILWSKLISFKLLNEAFPSEKSSCKTPMHLMGITEFLLMFLKNKISHLCPIRLQWSLGLLFIPLQPPARLRRISVGVELDMHDVRVAATRHELFLIP